LFEAKRLVCLTEKKNENLTETQIRKEKRSFSKESQTNLLVKRENKFCYRKKTQLACFERNRLVTNRNRGAPIV
jgi:hypothetical protein